MGWSFWGVGQAGHPSPKDWWEPFIRHKSADAPSFLGEMRISKNTFASQTEKEVCSHQKPVSAILKEIYGNGFELQHLENKNNLNT